MAKLERSYGKRLVIFAKAPQMGRVKTRLARELGFVAATRWYRGACASLIGRLAFDRRWATTLAVSPDGAAKERAPWPQVWPRGVPRRPQGPGDLGQRMERVFQTFPPGPVALIGSDIPGITCAHIAQAFKALGSHDAVIGPSTDGGYWLIGFSRVKPVRAAFDNVRWSSEHALADTLKNLINGKSVAFLPILQDVDEAVDLDKVRGSRQRV